MKRRINGIQCHPSFHCPIFLHLESDLLGKLYSRHSQIESFWHQSSGVSWLQQGDRTPNSSTCLLRSTIRGTGFIFSKTRMIRSLTLARTSCLTVRSFSGSCLPIHPRCLGSPWFFLLSFRVESTNPKPGSNGPVNMKQNLGPRLPGRR